MDTSTQEQAPQGEGTGALSSRDSSRWQGNFRQPLMEAMGDLPTHVGEGEFRQPLMEALCQGLRDVVLDVQEMKGALYDTWEVEPGSPYVEEALLLKEQYAKDCRTKKGQNLGD